METRERRAQIMAQLDDFYANCPPWETGGYVWFHRPIEGRPHERGPVCWCQPTIIDRTDFRGPRAAFECVMADQRLN